MVPVMPAQARVASSTAAGFHVSYTATVAATPEAIWAQLAHPERWWSKDHSWSGDAANFSLGVKPGGCFCEKLPGGGFVEHARVIYAAPGKMLRLSGGLGPLQGEAVAGTLTITIKAGEAQSSTLDFDYVVGGYARFDLKELAPVVDGVVGEQHKRLGQLVATGKPE
ncbi:MAG: ATPase [Rhodospirillaceae bacterium]|nr:ATPase [Rhodospirillaceae bacterium]